MFHAEGTTIKHTHNSLPLKRRDSIEGDTYRSKVIVRQLRVQDTGRKKSTTITYLEQKEYVRLEKLVNLQELFMTTREHVFACAHRLFRIDTSSFNSIKSKGQETYHKMFSNDA